MTSAQPLNLIIDRLADASRRSRNSAIVWFVLGAVFQAGVVALIFKAQSFAGAGAGEKSGFFFFVSPFAAWLPMAVGVYYWRRSKKSAMRSGNLLQRALTIEPQLIGGIYQEKRIVQPEIIEKPVEKSAVKSDERGADIAGAIFESVVEIGLSAAFGSSGSDSTNDYGNGASSSSNTPIEPRVFIRLTNGETHQINAPFAPEEIVAVLRRHAAHAALLEEI